MLDLHSGHMMCELTGIEDTWSDLRLVAGRYDPSQKHRILNYLRDR